MPALPIAAILIATTSLVPADGAWPRFRGPDGGGVATSAHDLPARLDADTRAWTCTIPAGHSSPCVVGDRIFVTGATDRDLRTLCIDRRTGELLWEQFALTDMFESRHGVNSAATPSPTSDGERVFVYFGSCGLVAYDLDGNELWMRRMRIPENMYGTASSPVVAGDRLVFVNDTAQASWIEAMDPTTGSTVWKTERSLGAGWSTPMTWRHGDVDEVVVYGAGWVTAYDVADGLERWSVPGLTDEPCTTPITAHGLVYITSYNMRTNPEVIGLPPYAELIAQYDANADGQLAYAEVRSNRTILSRNDADGEGDHPLAGFFRYLDENRDGQLTEAEWQKMIAFLDGFKFANGLIAIRPRDGDRDTEIAWTQDRGVPECPSPVCDGDRVYMVKNGGIVTCMDARTGERLFFARLGAGGPYYASLVCGDGKIYACSARGVVTVFAAEPALRILGQHDFEDRIMATPALVDDMVIVRMESALQAFRAPA